MKPTKIIYYHPKLPPYKLYADAPRPPIHWETGQGSWVGIWGYDWADLLGDSIIAHSSDFEFEVWQPDLRADGIYTHRFDSGLVHKLFPAQLASNGSGRHLHSPAVLNAIEEQRKKHLVILQTAVNSQLNWLVGAHPGVAVMGTYHGTIQLPHLQLFRLRRNLFRYVQLAREHFAFKRVLSNYQLITYQNDTNLDGLKQLYKGPLRKVTMGVDFDEFHPRSREESRRKLGLPQDKRVLLTVGRLNPLKQNDKVIDALNQCHDQDFLLAIVGTPNEPSYLNHLKQVAAPLLQQGKVIFPGYKKGAELIDYYSAADLFIMSSTSEGCSVASMEAIACGTPVFSTDTGYVAELLREKGKGCVVGIRDYQGWAKLLKKYLAGELEIAPYCREAAYRDFSWPAIAGKFTAAYEHLMAHG